MANLVTYPRTIYLIGANSYVAGQIKRHFTQLGHRVIGISHSTGFREVFDDGASIINCSASYQPENDWERMLRANYLFAKHLIERSNDTHTVINLASYFELGDTSTPGPINYYATAKLLLRAWLTDFARTRQIQAVNLLLYDVVGPGDQRNKLIPNILRLKAGDQIDLTGCEQIVNLVPVENIIEVISSVLQDRYVTGLFSISNTGFMPLKEYITTLQSIVGFKPIFGALPYGPTQIFNPVRDLPTLTSRSLLNFDHDYIAALLDGLGSRAPGRC